MNINLKPGALLTPDQAESATLLPDLMRRLGRADDRELYENNFAEFFKAAWHTVDSAPYQQTWAIDAVCDHLEAVTLGQIRRLLINIPPRCAKTNAASIAWNAWIWARSRRTFLSGAQVKFLSGSYNAQLALMASNKTRRMLLSPWYQSIWGDRFSLRLDQNTKTQFDNTAGGSRIATSVKGSLLGLGGDVICVDDPHNTETEKKIESDVDRHKVASWWQELSSTRLNDPKRTVMVVVMQRLHQGDLSGIILKAVEDGKEDFVHLCIPMEFEDRRQYWTVKLPQYESDDGEEAQPWMDPRIFEARETGRFGQLMWPDRFGTAEIEDNRNKLGPYMYAGRYQQSPVPKGGGIIKSDWWLVWNHGLAQRYGLEWTEGRKEFPRMDLIVGSLDTAMTEKDENNYSAMTVWGIFKDLNKNTRAMLMYGWQKRLPLNGMMIQRKSNEAEVQFKERQKREWGLVEWVADTCKRYGVKRLLIENKTRGHDVANEIRRLYARDPWGVWMVDPAGDKVSRTHSVVPLFTNGAIYAPVTKWSEDVITNVSIFPKGEFDDLHDTVTQFLNWVRGQEILILSEEMSASMEDQMRYAGPPDDTVANMYGI